MLPAYLLSLREGLEAALIIGIVLGALRKFRRPDLSASVWIGVFAALVVSLASAVALGLLGLALEYEAEEIFEGLTMLLAAGILTWVILWMSRQARGLKSSLESGVQQAMRIGRLAIFSLAFLSVLREGIELAIFLTAASIASSASQTILGSMLGLGTAVFLGWLLFAATIRLDLRRFFSTTGALLILFAAGLVALGVHELNEFGWIPPIVEHLWDTNTILNESSTLGQILKALFGYNANPSLTEVIAYLSYGIAMLLTVLLTGKARSLRPKHLTKNAKRIQ